MSEPKVTASTGHRGGATGRAAFLTFYFLLIATIWALLVAVSDPLRGGRIWASDLLLNPWSFASLCGSSAAETPVSITIAMWSLMSAGMMLPAVAPTIRAYFSLAAGQPLRIKPDNIWGLAGGYLAVWLAFSAGAGLLQGELAQLGLLSAQGISLSAPLTASLLLAAGLYQFSPLKAACLSRCRSPLAFFMSEWRDGFGGAMRMGLIHGLDCLGCCWALMLLAFVGGTMNLAWMALGTGLMTLEKLPSIGRPLTKPVGALLILSAASVVWIDFTAR